MPLPRPLPARDQSCRRTPPFREVADGHTSRAGRWRHERSPELDGCTKVYRVGSFGTRRLTAVSDVSFAVRAGEVVSLIGESGSGKSTIGRMILRLSPVTSGTIRFKGDDVSTYSDHRLKAYYRHAQGVFQDPFSSYNPVYKADRVFELVKIAYFRTSTGRRGVRRSKHRSRRSRSIPARSCTSFRTS